MEESYSLYRDISVNYFLSNIEQMNLIKLLNSNDCNYRNTVVWKLVLANIGLVHRAVIVFLKHSNKVEYRALMSLGILGAIKAIEKYDYSKGKLSTYIYSSVKRNLKEFEKENKAVNIEKHFYSKISIYNDCINEFYLKNGCIPSLSYIKDHTGLRDSDILLIQSTYDDAISLSEPIEDDVTLVDCIACEDSSVQEIVELRELKRIVAENLKKLSDVEIKILSYRYGLDNNKPMTQDEVAKLFNYSHQNISRLERKALTKLKKFKDLKKYYYE